MKNYSSSKVFTLICLIVFLVAACQPVSEIANEDEINSNNIHMLTSQRWQLVKLQSSDIALPKQQGRPFIVFIADTNKVEGFAGCNNFFGSYSQQNQVLTLSALGMTRRYCADTSALEVQYENMLSKVTNFTIIKHRLILLADKNELATFEAIK